MADDVAPPAAPENRRSPRVRGIPSFYHAVMAEMRKVTWPELPDVRRATDRDHHLRAPARLVIWVMDVVLQRLLVKLIPSLFAGR